MNAFRNGRACTALALLTLTAVIAAAAASLATGRWAAATPTAPPRADAWQGPAPPQLPGLNVTPERLKLPASLKGYEFVLPPNLGRGGVISSVPGVRDAIKCGEPVVEVSVAGPKVIRLTPGKPAVVEVNITYVGRASAPPAITVWLGGPPRHGGSGFVGYVFIPLRNVNPAEVPRGLKVFTVERPVTYAYVAGNATRRVLLGYRAVRGYYIPQYWLFKFKVGKVVVRRNSTVLVKAEVIMPKYVIGGKYYDITPPVYVGSGVKGLMLSYGGCCTLVVGQSPTPASGS